MVKVVAAAGKSCTVYNAAGVVATLVLVATMQIPHDSGH